MTSSLLDSSEKCYDEVGLSGTAAAPLYCISVAYAYFSIEQRRFVRKVISNLYAAVRCSSAGL